MMPLVPPETAWDPLASFDTLPIKIDPGSAPGGGNKFPVISVGIPFQPIETTHGAGVYLIDLTLNAVQATLQHRRISAETEHSEVGLSGMGTAKSRRLEKIVIDLAAPQGAIDKDQRIFLHGRLGLQETEASA